MMKNIIIASLLTILMAVTGVNAENKKVNHNKTVTFDVSMTCENCVRTIEKNIAFEKGMKDMKVDLPSKRVTLTFDTRKTDEEKIIKSFEKLGYEAVVTDNPSKKP